MAWWVATAALLRMLTCLVCEYAEARTTRTVQKECCLDFTYTLLPMNNKLLKYYAETLDNQAQENEEAAEHFLHDEDSINHLDEDWIKDKTGELLGRAQAARKLAAEMRAHISN